MHSKLFRQYTQPLSQYTNPWWKASQSDVDDIAVIGVGHRRPQYIGSDPKSFNRFPGTINIQNTICFAVTCLVMCCVINNYI